MRQIADAHRKTEKTAVGREPQPTITQVDGEEPCTVLKVPLFHGKMLLDLRQPMKIRFARECSCGSCNFNPSARSIAWNRRPDKCAGKTLNAAGTPLNVTLVVPVRLFPRIFTECPTRPKSRLVSTMEQAPMTATISGTRQSSVGQSVRVAVCALREASLLCKVRNSPSGVILKIVPALCVPPSPVTR